MCSALALTMTEALPHPIQIGGSTEWFAATVWF